MRFVIDINNTEIVYKDDGMEMFRGESCKMFLGGRYCIMEI
jgi:hypothetical protein